MTRIRRFVSRRFERWRGDLSRKLRAEAPRGHAPLPGGTGQSRDALRCNGFSYASARCSRGLQATFPLRSGGGHLTRHGGGRELALGIGGALGFQLRAPLSELDQAAPAQVLLDPPERPPQHLTDLAGLQMDQRMPDELAALLLVGTIEGHQVQMRIQPQIGRGPLNEGLPDIASVVAPGAVVL